MKILKNIYAWLAVSAVLCCGGTLTSCNDDIPAASYYTFTGEYLSDYLQKHEDYSMFAEIVERAAQSERGVSLMDLVACHGEFTCFAPTNEAITNYLKEHNYNSVSDIPYNMCDTLARTHLINGQVYNLVDFSSKKSIPTANMNGRTIQLVEIILGEDSEDDTDIHSTYRLNGNSVVIYELANDSVENGIVHPVDAVINSSNLTVSDFMLENDDLGLFNRALGVTGLANVMASRIEDKSWNPDMWDFLDGKIIYSGGQDDYCRIPQTKRYGFTVFACPDDVLRDKYNITDLQSFYDYAQGIYGGESLDVTDPANADKLQEWRSPLRRLIGYHCLNRACSYDKLTTICTIDRFAINPTEWYSTMDSLSTLKIESVATDNNKVKADLYLNRGDLLRGDTDPGVHVLPNEHPETSNGFYYVTDGLVNFGQEVKDRIFNTRIRMDLYTLFPELETNKIRTGVTTGKELSECALKDSPSPNYLLPQGYLDNVKINDDGLFLYQGCSNSFWSYEGDEFNLTSDVGNYDITFNLPSVPTGTYQIRLGFANMPTRGICQFYLDGQARGIPFDMRDASFETRTGWFALTPAESSMDDEDLEAAKKNMHNQGWYHGPKGVYSVNGSGHKDEEVKTGTYFCNNARTSRFVLCTATLDEDIQHTIRIKSVWAPQRAVVMIDYIELVPKSIYNNPSKPEDDY